jgi:hypothetical protein
MFNTDFITQATLASAATVPIIVALCQVFKMTGWVKDKYAPFLSIILGIVIAFLLVNNDGVAGNDFNIGNTVLTGILFGLSASGLYSGLRSTSDAIKMDRMNKRQKDKQAYRKYDEDR